MGLIVGIEVLTIYIILIYLNEMDRYSVIVMIGIGICLIMGSSNRWVGLLMLVIMWPMFSRYINGSLYELTEWKLGKLLKRLWLFY